MDLSSFSSRYSEKFLTELKGEIENYILHQYEEDDDYIQIIRPILNRCFDNCTNEIYGDYDEHEKLEDAILAYLEHRK